MLPHWRRAALLAILLGLNAAARAGEGSPDDVVVRGRPIATWLDWLGSEEVWQRRDAIAALVEAFHDPGDAERSLEVAWTRMVDQLRKGEPRRSMSVLEVLDAAPWLPWAWEERMRWLRRTRTRRKVAQSLAALGPAAIPRLAAIVRHGYHGMVRDVPDLAGEALVAAGPSGIDALRATLRDKPSEDSEERPRPEAAIRALARSPAAALAAFDDVMALLTRTPEDGSFEDLRWRTSDVLEWDMRVEAAAAAGSPAVPRLLALVLRDDNDLAAFEALRVLALMRSAARAAAPTLLDLAGRADIAPQRRAQLLVAVLAVDPGQAEAVWSLLSEKPEDEFWLEATSLYRLGPRIARPLGAALSHTNPMLRRHAAATLAMMVEGASRAADDLRRALDSSDEYVRITAIGAVGAAVAARSRVPTGLVERLVALAADTDPRVREAAIESLGDLGTSAKAAGDVLAKAVRSDSSPSIRIAAVLALARAAPDRVGEEEADRLIDLLGGGSYAFVTIADLPNPVPARLVPRLVDRLPHASKEQALDIVRVLGRMGQVAEPALPLLTKLGERDDSSIRAEVREAISWIQQASALPDPGATPDRWLASLDAPDPRLRRAAARRLVGGDAAVVVPRLVARLEDADADVREAAAASLGKWSSAARSAVPALVRHLDDEDQDAAAQAITALGAIAEQPDIAVPALRAALADEDLVYHAAIALGRFGPAARAAVPDLEGVFVRWRLVVATTAIHRILEE